MIDELMDSLVLDRLPSYESLQSTLNDLCRGAEDIDPILHSFKNSHHLRVGVRDILGKEDIRATTATLSDIAEVCLQLIVCHEYRRLAKKYGEPSPNGHRAETERAIRGLDAERARPGQVALQTGLPRHDGCDLVIVALGKFGGREPNYHSDLDIIFLYQNEGMTRHRGRARRGETTTNQHFFSQLGQRIIRVVNRLGPYGRLYELDPRLRPTGKSGTLAVSVEEFSKYFAQGHGQLWERQALCRARPIFGSETARQTVMQAVRRAIVQPGWTEDDAAAIHQMRQRLQDSASRHNLKRGPGGTVDVEFAVQMLQLRHAAASPSVLVPGTIEALEALHENHYLDEENYRFFCESYRFLRSVEARLRLMNTTARHDLPQDDGERAKLAYLLGRADTSSLLADCRRFTAQNRQRFEGLFAVAMR
jgi:glutamate-ammonia-ligase adenylyltransferase